MVCVWYVIVITLDEATGSIGIDREKKGQSDFRFTGVLGPSATQVGSAYGKCTIKPLSCRLFMTYILDDQRLMFMSIVVPWLSYLFSDSALWLQEQLFSHCDLTNDVVNGISCCIMAYGQTGELIPIYTYILLSVNRTRLG
jgi:hypothetical protein